MDKQELKGELKSYGNVHIYLPKYFIIKRDKWVKDFVSRNDYFGILSIFNFI